MCMAPPPNSLHSRAHTIPAGRPLVLVHMGKKEKEKVPQVFPLLPNGCTETSTPFGCGKRRSGSTCCLFLFFPCCPTCRAEKPTPPSDVGQVGVKDYSLPFVPLLSCSVKVPWSPVLADRLVQSQLPPNLICPQMFPLLPNGCTETSTPFGCGKRRSGSTCCLFLFFPCCPTSRAEKPTPPSDVGQVGVKEYSLPFVPLLSCSVRVQ